MNGTLHPINGSLQFVILMAYLGQFMIFTLQNALKNALLDDDKDAALEAIKKLEKDDVNFIMTFKNPLNKLTPLMLACESDVLGAEVVEALLAKGAKIKATDLAGRNALHYAQDFDQLAIAEVLVAHDPSLRTQGDNKGNTPLHEAAGENKLDFLQCYLNLWIDGFYEPCDVDVTNGAEETPLHKATQNGHTEAAKMLLQKEASADARDNANYSPFHYAKGLAGISAKHQEIASILAPHTIPSLFTLVSMKLIETYQGREQEVKNLIGEIVHSQAEEKGLLYHRHLQDVKAKQDAVKLQREEVIERFKKMSLQ
ncbi:MAG: hypothetical protein BGO43_06290 [Gammaproteobacteria bacterium 39-13]|nr:ankyrin repeat domain-containing protein [Gammaproteobacteria bacterium]OJV90455.1 MAG: hypothetical protein BGO43_06290 [Gammaproteobacteria bacterium 39-13]